MGWRTDPIKYARSHTGQREFDCANNTGWRDNNPNRSGMAYQPFSVLVMCESERQRNACPNTLYRCGSGLFWRRPSIAESTRRGCCGNAIGSVHALLSMLGKFAPVTLGHMRSQGCRDLLVGRSNYRQRRMCSATVPAPIARSECFKPRIGNAAEASRNGCADVRMYLRYGGIQHD
jgi:hypothetical protein